MSKTEFKTAEAFAKKMKSIGFNCDFSKDSLMTQIDSILNSNKVCLGGEKPECWENEVGLEAYIGETLLRLYEGNWQGTFDSKSPSDNFYFSFVKFDEYDFYPSHFIGYKVINGEKAEGTFNEYISRVLPKMTTNIT